ncbi:MAG TPA: ABC transporter permease [Chitinophagaceae bacterium]|nr:ABC transporter permease [Chitinophagaceae bacterium]
MSLQNIKQIVRSLWRYKSFSVINLLGLSLGIAAIIVIFLLVNYENNFDKFHKDDNNIYRVVAKNEAKETSAYSAAVPYSLAKLLRTELPGLPATEIHYVNDMNIRIGNNSPFSQKQVLFGDSLFFKVFDYSSIKNFWITGNPETALNEPRKAILTESTAKKFFGNENPVGRILRLDNKADVEVVAIVKDLPATSHLPFSMIVSFSTLTKEFVAGLDLDQWGVRSNGYCYTRINNNTRQIEQALHAIVQRNAETDREKQERMYLQPLGSIHFDSTFADSNPSYTVGPKYISMLILLGFFIIMVACINYINLSTSLAFSKSKEVGIRKTIGASRRQLFFYYLSETLLLTVLATALAFILSYVLLPVINTLLEKSVSFRQLLDPIYIGSGLIALLLTSFLSGVYPALVLSGFNPIVSLKNQFILPGRFSTLFRKGLIVFQFTTSIALIICTAIIAKQTQYFSKRSLGFNKESVVEVALPVNDSSKMESFRNLLENDPGVKNISFCLGAPVSDNGFNTSVKAPELFGKNEQSIKLIPCDINYLTTYEIKLLAGRWFFPSEEIYRDSVTAIVINETMARTLGYRDPADAIGKKIMIGINDLNLPIIGVTTDFHTTSLHKVIQPTGLLPFGFFYYAAGIRIDPSNIKKTLGSIETAWKKIYPESVYEFKFIDETLAKRYEQETRDYNLFKAFSVISIFICCIGLWGLIAFVVVRKTKEIGIRKVLGSSIRGIVYLLSKDFLKLVIIALLIASPIAWYFMNKWLHDFAYRITISWWVFVIAGIAAVVIALITISFQAIKAAIANPVKSLRTE